MSPSDFFRCFQETLVTSSASGIHHASTIDRTWFLRFFQVILENGWAIQKNQTSGQDFPLLLKPMLAILVDIMPNQQPRKWVASDFYIRNFIANQ
jgi:hypothetical protein